MFPLDVRDYPHLGRPLEFGSRRVRLLPWVEGAVRDSDVTHAYVVPFLSDRTCLAGIRHDLQLVVPGGTRAGAECWTTTARREVLEETGHVLGPLAPFAIFETMTAGKELSYRVVCWADARSEHVDVADPSGSAGVAGVVCFQWRHAPGLFALAGRPASRRALSPGRVSTGRVGDPGMSRPRT